MREGRTDSLIVERTDATAECVNGDVIVRRDNLVTCDFKAVDEAERSGRASFADSSADGGAFDGEEKADWNWSRRVRVVVSVTVAFFDILKTSSE